MTTTAPEATRTIADRAYGGGASIRACFGRIVRALQAPSPAHYLISAGHPPLW